MARNVRRTGGVDMFDAIITQLQAAANAVVGFANIANATTNGKLKTQTATGYRIDGQVYSLGVSDNFWTLSALSALTANQYQAIALYVDASGTASIGAGTVVTNTVSAAAGRLAALAVAPALVSTKSIIGVFVAGSSGSTDYTAALTGQGALYHGVPPGYGTLTNVPLSPVGVSDFLTIVAP